MDNVEEMDKFLEKYNFPKLKQEEIENCNRPITSTEVEIVIRNLPANKSPGPGSFTTEFYWDPESLRPALSLGGQASAWECEGELGIALELLQGKRDHSKNLQKQKLVL